MEISEPQAEKNLLADIERLRIQFPQTQELYREVCTLMFFRYGMTPTANRLYQLVRKGSMSAPAEALSRFWEQLREKSRVAIEHPDLPDELKKAAGELTAALWTTAQNAATQTLDIFLSEAKSQIELARLAEAKAANQRDNVADALLKAQEAQATAAQQIAQLQQELAAAAATRTALDDRLTEARNDNATQREHFDTQRREYAAELDRSRSESATELDKLRREHAVEQDKLRTQVALAEERSEAMQKHALLEMDRERTNQAKLQKVLDAERAASAAVIERQRIEYNIQQTALADLRQQVGAFEGRQQTTAQARDEALDQLDQLRQQLSNAAAQTIYANSRAEHLQEQLQSALAAEAQRVAAAVAGERGNTDEPEASATEKRSRRHKPD